MTAMAMTACTGQKAEKAEATQDNFNYVVDQFADLQILRYRVPGFESLSLKQKQLLYHLSEAALMGRDILFDQNCRYNLPIRRALEAVYTGYKGDRTDPQFVALETYLKRVWFANRIHQASFSIEGTTYLLEKNDGENTNHGGLSGFHKKIWQWKRTDSGIRFLLHSPDMEGGYPGNVQAEVEYQFTETNELTISYHGTTDRPTYLNLTNHAYFNLSGDKRKITEHELMIPAARILETTSQFIPTGQAQDVKDSPFDFSTSRSIGAHLYDDNEQLHWNKGYNHCYILKEESSDTLLTAAVLSDPFSGRRLTVRTDLPGVLLYTAGYLAPTPDIGVCLETQYFPDTPSHPHFPSCLLMPGEEYRHRTIYTFDK